MKVVPPAPVFVADSREQLPWSFEGATVVRGKLDAGDYSVVGGETIFAVERKSMGDLIGTLTVGRERFERELALLAAMRRAIIIVEGPLADVIEWRYRSRVSPLAIVNSIASFHARFGVATAFAGSRRDAEHLARAWLTKAAKHLLAPAVEVA